MCDYLLAEQDIGNTICVIFLDFAKPFDTVDHTILLYKLEENSIKIL